MSISFRQFEIFCAVASFTRASQIPFISQSTVSQHSQHIGEPEAQPAVRLL